jgi:hypothetical protein
MLCVSGSILWGGSGLNIQVHFPKQWLGANPIAIKRFQLFGFCDITPLNLSRIISTYQPRPCGDEPGLGSRFRHYFIFCQYDNLPVQSGSIGQYDCERNTVEVFVTHCVGTPPFKGLYSVPVASLAGEDQCRSLNYSQL